METLMNLLISVAPQAILVGGALVLTSTMLLYTAMNLCIEQSMATAIREKSGKKDSAQD
jgi:hypothetical protein